MTSNAPAFAEWAIVDVMGHQRYIGRVTEQVIAGSGFVRIDVPATTGQAAWTKLIGTGSIYAITPTTEAIARAMAEERQEAPISRYDLPESMRALPAPTRTADQEREDLLDGFDDADDDSGIF